MLYRQTDELTLPADDAGEIRPGEMVWIDLETGKVGRFKPYTRWERFVRWFGRLWPWTARYPLRRLCMLRRYHQRRPMGRVIEKVVKADTVTICVRGTLEIQDAEGVYHRV